MLNVEVLYVSSKTLFRHSSFTDLSESECRTKALEDGWRWDLSSGKYYRIKGY